MSLVDFVAGCVGGVAGVLVGHPFDTVKVGSEFWLLVVRLQTQKKTASGKPMYSGSMDCFFQIVKKESVFGLYKGLASPLVGLTFINAIIFGVHGNLYRQMVPGAKSQFVAGTIAGMVQSLILCPMELAKIKLQIQGQGLRLDKTQRTYLGPIDCLKKVLATEGVSGCFRGLTMTLIRDGPGFGAYFAIYHLLCLSFVPRGKTVADLGPLPLLISGGLTGMITWAIVYPTDVIKSRIQAEGIVPFGKYKSNWDCIAQSYSKEGLGVFTRGLYVTIFRAFPVNAATFAAFTLSLRFMNDLKL